jgi:phosphoribosyl 1,2-cyclic phosphodiesterase
MFKFCSLSSGSSGNSIFIAYRNTKILVDAGLSGKKISAALTAIGENPAELNAVVITHEHIDHIRGAGIISRKLNIPIYANPKTWKAMEHLLGPVRLDNQKHFTSQNPFEVGSIGVQPFLIPHDAAEPVGLSFVAGGKKVTIATDIGYLSGDLLKNMEQSHLVLLESNHDLEMLQNGSYPYYLKHRILSDHGHLSNDAAGEAAVYLANRGTCRIILGHLSKENNLPQLAYDSVAQALSRSGLKTGTDIHLAVAYRDLVGNAVNI